jgi:hypothetical protein
MRRMITFIQLPDRKRYALHINYMSLTNSSIESEEEVIKQ